MKNLVKIWPLLLLPLTGICQEEQASRFVKKGLLRMQGTIASGNFLISNYATGTNVYLHGDLEYFVDQNLSVRSESYYYLGNYNGVSLLTANHSNFAGVFYHIPTKGNFDPYLGVQPGINYSKLSDTGAQTSTYGPVPEGQVIDDLDAVSPMVGISAGFNYFAKKFFHFFIHTKYVTGKHLSDYGSLSLSELKVSFGLGINFQVLKTEKKAK